MITKIAIRESWGEKVKLISDGYDIPGCLLITPLLVQFFLTTDDRAMWLSQVYPAKAYF